MPRIKRTEAKAKNHLVQGLREILVNYENPDYLADAVELWGVSEEDIHKALEVVHNALNRLYSY